MAIDPVRVISNISTGELAHAISEEAQKQGARITILEGQIAHPLEARNVKIIKFRFFHELSELLDKELKKNYDIIIHAAAVSDYRLESQCTTKLPSNRSRLRLNLIPTQKLINKIKKQNPTSYLVGFKLETRLGKSQLIAKAGRLIKTSGCDLVVANTLADKKYSGYILDNMKHVLAGGMTRRHMARNLIRILKEKI